MRKLSLLFILLLSITYTQAQEICDNGIDDTGNGLIDLNDPECDCVGFGVPQIIPSLIPNPSFENHTCCPTWFSHLYCADTWMQATNATTDYFNCGYTFNALSIPNLFAPDGTAFVGTIFQNGWKEYVGACLLSPLLAGETYLLSFYIASVGMTMFTNQCVATHGDVEVSIFGTSNCGTLPLNTYDCPSVASAAWSLIGSKVYSPIPVWEIITIEFTPTSDINEIMIGAPCNLTSDYDSSGCTPYFVYDKLILASTNFYNSLGITQQGELCTDDLVLSSTSDSLGGDWQWYYEGIAIVGETDSVLDVSANSFGPGKYTVKYTLGAKCETEYLIIKPPQTPVANFNHLDVCLGDDINFLDSSVIDTSGGVFIDSWEWDFDNGNNSTNQNPTFNYSAPGDYLVQLKVKGNNSCEDSITKTITIHPFPIANFDFDTVCNQKPSNFINLSLENGGTTIDNWNWSFGDGNYSTLENPSPIYINDSIYSVRLIAESAFGCRDTIIKDVVVWPIPNVDFLSTKVCMENPTDFTDLTTISNTVLNNSLFDWQWSFGDGSTSNLQNPSHEYTNDGAFNVVLEVTSNQGCKNEISKIVIVHPLPEVSFVGFEIKGCSPICPAINSTSFINSPSIISSLEWTLSDGTSYSGNGFSDCFESSIDGSTFYDLILKATSNEGCVAEHTESSFIAVHPNPIADFYYHPEEPSVIEEAVVFYNTSSFANSYDWTFGNIGSSNEVSPSFIFPYEHNQYQIILVAKTLESCTDTLIKTIDILDKIIFYIPNAFTPDHNTINQTFQPVFTSGFEPQNFALSIYNRWGELIFESFDASIGWDGTYGLEQGKSAKAGTYIWKIVFEETMSNKMHVHKGHVTLLK